MLLQHAVRALVLGGKLGYCSLKLCSFAESIRAAMMPSKWSRSEVVTTGWKLLSLALVDRQRRGAGGNRRRKTTLSAVIADDRAMQTNHRVKSYCQKRSQSRVG